MSSSTRSLAPGINLKRKQGEKTDRNVYRKREREEETIPHSNNHHDNHVDEEDEETKLENQQQQYHPQKQKLTARQKEYNAEAQLWEANRLLNSGTLQRTHVSTEHENEEEQRVHLMIRRLEPPFLDGRIIFTKQMDPINPIRDATADLAKIAKAGSAIVKEIRERNEKKTGIANLAGTALGNIMRVKEEEEEKLEEKANGGKGDSEYGNMKQAAAVSDFAKHKTIREQREFLPVFAVRDELLRIVRENQGNLHSATTQSNH